MNQDEKIFAEKLTFSSLKINIENIDLGGIQLLRAHLGGRDPLKCKHMRTEGGGGSVGLCQCKRLHIHFFNLVPSP